METAFIAMSLLCVQTASGSQCMSNVQQMWFPTVEMCEQALHLEREYQHGLADKAGEVIYNEVRRCILTEVRPSIASVN